jgi:hypothetical protein
MGKKLFAGTAVFNAQEQLVGRVLVIWISLSSQGGFILPEKRQGEIKSVF